MYTKAQRKYTQRCKILRLSTDSDSERFFFQTKVYKIERPPEGTHADLYFVYVKFSFFHGVVTHASDVLHVHVHS
jgi:hypothetical protein